MTTAGERGRPRAWSSSCSTWEPVPMSTSAHTLPEVEATLRAVVEPLSALVRRAGSADERRAAEMIADAFERAGAPARIDEEEFRDGYAALLLPLGIAGLLAGLGSSSRPRPPLAALVSAAAAAALIDDVENRSRVWRRAVARPKGTTNVVGECGDLEADRTLVVLSHHDAA